MSAEHTVVEETSEDDAYEYPKKTWNYLGPQTHTRLFYKVITHDESGAVNWWLKVFKGNTQRGIYEFVQLAVDLAGYQHLDVEAYSTRNDYGGLVEYMEENLSPTFFKISGRYVLREKTTTFKNSINKLSKFINEFIEVIYSRNYIFCSELIKSLMKLWTKMSNSKLCSPRHTGLFFGIKFKTGLLKVKKTVTNTIDDKVIEKYIKTIETKIFEQNWSIDEPKLNRMRVHCVQEIQEWMTVAPDSHLVDEWLQCLIKYMTDRCKEVRYFALSILFFALQKYEYRTNFRGNMKEYIKHVADRLRDVEMKASVLAVNILCFIAQKYRTLSNEIKKLVLSKVYCFHAPLAIASGEYLAHQLQTKSNGDIEKLTKLVNFHIQSEKLLDVTVKPSLVVDAVIDYIPELKNVSTYLSVLKKMNAEITDDKFNIILLDVLTETAQIVFNGLPTYQRQDFTIRTVNKKDADALLAELNEALRPISKYYKIVHLAKLMRVMVRYEKRKDAPK